MDAAEERRFERECRRLGMCPRCLNAGEREDNLGLGGVCLTCGYSYAAVLRCTDTEIDATHLTYEYL